MEIKIKQGALEELVEKDIKYLSLNRYSAKQLHNMNVSIKKKASPAPARPLAGQ
ncbi:hypothetical protein [Planococcus chinensis]|uniref:Fur-regulated basic protein FbpA n=1 Tax=Planococcus chinensis TaxID=272917 RepID=A0ABW4QGH4_9BACL